MLNTYMSKVIFAWKYYLNIFYKHKIYWVSLDSICLGNKEGGLGVMKMREFNPALSEKAVLEEVC